MILSDLGSFFNPYTSQELIKERVVIEFTTENFSQYFNKKTTKSFKIVEPFYN